MAVREGIQELPPYAPDVETLFDIADLKSQYGDDYVLRVLSDIATSNCQKDEEE